MDDSDKWLGEWWDELDEIEKSCCREINQISETASEMAENGNLTTIMQEVALARKRLDLALEKAALVQKKRARVIEEAQNRRGDSLPESVLLVLKREHCAWLAGMRCSSWLQLLRYWEQSTMQILGLLIGDNGKDLTISWLWEEKHVVSVLQQSIRATRLVEMEERRKAVWEKARKKARKKEESTRELGEYLIYLLCMLEATSSSSTVRPLDRIEEKLESFSRSAQRKMSKFCRSISVFPHRAARARNRKLSERRADGAGDDTETQRIIYLIQRGHGVAVWRAQFMLPAI
jgi:hypothetical protein